MSLALFYYTLVIMLAAILAAAVCLSAYLVSLRRTMLIVSIAFVFYFFDIALIFQDEYTITTVGNQPGYLVIRSIASMLTGGGFLTAAWIAICNFLGLVKRRVLLIVPPLVYLVASLIALLYLPDGNLQRFCFYSMRQVFLFWMLAFLGLKYMASRDETERNRMKRYRGIFLLAWVLSICVVAEDALVYFVVDPALAKQGIGFVLTGERNYMENILMLACAFLSIHNARRMLSLRSEKPPMKGDNQQEHYVSENLPFFAKKHGLSARESEVLYLILMGKDNQNIASEMQLALSTVKVHVHNILRKAKCSNRQELIEDFWVS